MNHFLVSNLNRLNKLLAIVLILAGVIGGQAVASMLAQLNIGSFLGAIIGLAVGIVAAILTCGSVAILIEILDALRRMEAHLSRLYASVDGLDDDLRHGRLGSPSAAGPPSNRRKIWP